MYAELTMRRRGIRLILQPIEWTAEIPGDVRTVWIEPFRFMELTESGVNTIIPGSSPDFRREAYSGESEISCILHAKTFDT
jgi:hypothetical protein